MTTPSSPRLALGGLADMDGTTIPALLLMLQALTSDCQCATCRVLRDIAHRLGRAAEAILVANPATEAPDPPQKPPAGA